MIQKDPQDFKDQARQGDVFIFRAPKKTTKDAPVDREENRVVLAHGEVTGHAHAIKDKEAALFTMKDAEFALDRLLRSEKKVCLKHEEHDPIQIPKGDFIVRRQREYDPIAERIVAD